MGVAASTDGATAFLAEASLPPYGPSGDVFAVLMVGLFFAMVSITGIGIWWLRRFHFDSKPSRPSAPSVSLSIFDAPVRWLAVRSTNLPAVQHALELQNVRSCTWGDALSAPFEPRLFIAPPASGWILVMGCDLPDPGSDIDECFLFLTKLSQKLGEVQFFSRNRALSHHGWARLDRGSVVRAYFWAGETLWHQGHTTVEERELRFRCLTYTESSEVLGLAGRETLSSNTEKVLRLAASWSVDPTALAPAALDAKGIAGDLLHWKLH